MVPATTSGLAGTAWHEKQLPPLESAIIFSGFISIGFASFFTSAAGATTGGGVVLQPCNAKAPRTAKNIIFFIKILS
jgi:hypothetical protein